MGMQKILLMLYKQPYCSNTFHLRRAEHPGAAPVAEPAGARVTVGAGTTKQSIKTIKSSLKGILLVWREKICTGVLHVGGFLKFI